MKTIKKICIICLFISLVFLSACNKTNKDDDSSKEDIPTFKVIENEDLIKSPGYIKWEGRYEYKSKEGRSENFKSQVALYHTGTGFTITFYGTELKVSFIHTCSSDISGTNIYYNVAVDNETLPNPAPNRTFYLKDAEVDKEITIVSGLPLGKHTVKCLKMDEAKDAYTSIYKVKCDGGFYKRNLDEDNKNLKFMFICASGGSGYGSLAYTESASTTIVRTRANSSSLHAFMYLCARMYNADTQFVATSGWGIAFDKTRAIKDVFDYTGITVSNTVDGAKTTALWDHSSWVPDVIIFNIGGNDTKRSSFILNEYQTAVTEMVTKLHNLYPNAKMLWTRTSGSKCGTYAINALKNAGIMNEGYIKEAIIPQVGDDGTYGAASHNSLKTHITTADNIAQTLSVYYGLTKTRENILFEDFESILEKYD